MKKQDIKKGQKVILLIGKDQLMTGESCYVTKIYDDDFVDLSNKSDGYCPQDDCIAFREARRVPICTIASEN